MSHVLRHTKCLPNPLMMSLGILLRLAASPILCADEIEGHCVANCGDGGGGGGGHDGGGWGAGGWRGGQTYTPPAAPTPKQRAYEANQRGAAYYNQQQWGNALAAFQEALALTPDDPVIQQNARNAEEHVRRAQAEAMQAADRQRKEAATSASIREGIHRLTANLTTQSAGVNFDGRAQGTPPSAGLDFMSASTAPRPAPAASPAAPFVDSSVVDLRDAKTLTVDPAKVAGQPTPAPPSLEFMDLHDQAANIPQPAPTAASTSPSGSAELDTMVNFALGLPFDHETFLKISPERMQQFIDHVQKDPAPFNNAILRKELEAADRAGESSPYVELEILSRDPTLHDRVEAVRDRVRQQQLKACFDANHAVYEEGKRAMERIQKQLGYADDVDYRVLEADARYQQAVTQALDPIWRRHDETQQRAQATAERELAKAAKQLRGNTSLDVDAETRKLRQEYLHLHHVLEHPDQSSP